MGGMRNIFMPEELCARCNEDPPLPSLSTMFKLKDEVDELGFCSEDCYFRFVQAMESLQEGF